MNHFANPTSDTVRLRLFLRKYVHSECIGLMKRCIMSSMKTLEVEPSIDGLFWNIKVEATEKREIEDYYEEISRALYSYFTHPEVKDVIRHNAFRSEDSNIKVMLQNMENGKMNPLSLCNATLMDPSGKFLDGFYIISITL